MSPSPLSATVMAPAAVQVSVVSEPVKAVVIGGYGPPGPQGPAGPAGAGAFEYVVALPVTSVTVPHNLGRYPAAVTFYDTGGDEVDTGVIALDLNTIEITMAAALAGRVVVE